MKIQAVATGLIGILIAILVITTVAMPAIEDSVNGTSYTGTNMSQDSTYRYVSSSPTFAWSTEAGSAAFTYTIDGNAATAGGRNEIVNDAFGLRWTAAGEVSIWNWDKSTYFSGTSANAVAVTVTSGSYSIVIDGADAVTGTCTMALLPDSEGTWGYFGSGFKATLGQEVITGHLTNVSNLGPINFATVKDGEVQSFLVEPVKVAAGGTLAAASDVTYDFSFDELGETQAVGYYAGVEYTYESVTKNSLRVYAPLEFQSTAVEDGGGINSTLLLLIPVLLLIVAVMMAVRMLREA